MNKNNGNAAEQGGLRRGVAPPGVLLIDEPEQGGCDGEPEQGGLRQRFYEQK